jgi:hypothetical protein
MPELIFNNAQVFLGTSSAIGSTSAGVFDISTFVTRIRLQRQFDLHDDTRMGLTAHSRIAGIEDWTAELELLQDFASTSVAAAMGLDKLIASILGVRARMAIRPVLAARSSDNPEFDGIVMLESYSPMDGAVGDLLKLTIPFRSAGSLTRTVAAT